MKYLFHEVVKELQISPTTPFGEPITFESLDDRGNVYRARSHKGDLEIEWGIPYAKPMPIKYPNELFNLVWKEVSPSIHWSDALRYWKTGEYVIACVLEGYIYWFTGKEVFVDENKEPLTTEMLSGGKWYAKERSEESEDDYEI